MKVVTEKIKIKLSSFGKKDYAEIAVEIFIAFKLNQLAQNKKLAVKVEGGWVTLEGREWDFQKEANTKVIISLDGVKIVTNNITLKTAVRARVKIDECDYSKIDSAFGIVGTHFYPADIYEFRVEVKKLRAFLKNRSCYKSFLASLNTERLAGFVRPSLLNWRYCSSFF